jgi:alpha-tubulin suppressor-like RCC1 family protein
VEGNTGFTTTVRVTDAFGNTVPTATNAVTLEIGRRAPFGGAARLLGTPTVAAVAGVATFNNLRVDLAGAGYTVNARSGSLQTAGSDEFAVRLTFTRVDAGGGHTCAITVNASAYCWGNNTSGQLGLGSFATDSVPRLVTGGFSWASISAGNAFTCGITTTDALFCWGSNGSGQIATGAFGGSFAEPQPITAPSNLRFNTVSAGGNHVCATTVTTASGAAAGGYCWGNGGNGEIGDGTNTTVNVVTAVAGGLAFKAITAGDNGTCAIETTDLAWCWGYNGEGMIAVNDIVTPKSTPQLVNASTAYAQAVMGSVHSCFREVHVPVDVLCAGRGSSGQIGNGANNQVNDETLITSQLPWTKLAAGGNTNCLLDDVGLAYCFGAGTSGQIGNSAIVNQNVRQPVTGGRSYVDITVGSSHACAITAAGQVWCWGAQSTGRLGNGQVANVPRADPLQVIQQ